VKDENDLDLTRALNGAAGASDIEGKAAREAVSECGKRTSFNAATGASDMSGGLGSRLGRSVVAVEISGS
jgi:hypothetical protein